MPQLANLVLTDRATTPVAHTLIPRDITNGIGAVYESSGVPIGELKFTVGVTKTASGRYKATARLQMPTVVDEIINGVSRPSVARTAYADLTFTFDETSTEQERKNLVGMLQSSLDTSKWTNDVLTKLQSVY
jgi:hypothetical protein